MGKHLILLGLSFFLVTTAHAGTAILYSENCDSPLSDDPRLGAPELHGPYVVQSLDIENSTRFTITISSAYRSDPGYFSGLLARVNDKIHTVYEIESLDPQTVYQGSTDIVIPVILAPGSYELYSPDLYVAGSDQRSICFEVIDNGDGFTPAPTPAGLLDAQVRVALSRPIGGGVIVGNGLGGAGRSGGILDNPPSGALIGEGSGSETGMPSSSHSEDPNSIGYREDVSAQSGSRFDANRADDNGNGLCGSLSLNHQARAPSWFALFFLTALASLCVRRKIRNLEVQRHVGK